MGRDCEGMMIEELLFRMALAPTAFFIWTRYVTWPFFIMGVSTLILFRFRPAEAAISKLLFIQRTMVGAAVLLSISLAVAYFLIPETDRQLGVLWYGALLGSLPVLIPSIAAIFLSPKKLLDKTAMSRSLS